MKKTIIRCLFIGILAFGVAACNNKPSNGKDAANKENKTETGAPQQNNAKVATITDFNATWCGPCQQFKPIFEELEKEFSGKITFKAVDVDQNQDLAMKWNVQSIPTILFQDAEGNEIAREVGFRTKEQMVQIINKFQ